MKKFIIVAVMTVFMVCANAQEPLSFEKVITVDSVSKNEIYSGLKSFYSMNYNSKYVYELDDRETGIMIVNLITDYRKKGFAYVSYTGFIKFTIKIQVKDGRFKATVCNFIHDAAELNKPSQLGLSKSITLFGLIMNGPNNRKSINKPFDDKVWADLQQKCELISIDLFDNFEKLKFKSDNW